MSIDVCACNDTSAIEIVKCDHSDHELFFEFKVKKIIRKLLVNIYRKNYYISSKYFDLRLITNNRYFFIFFNSAQLELEIAIKSDNNKLRRVFKLPKTEWCSLMEGSSKNSNRFFKAFLDTMRETTPEIFIKCPFSGVYEFYNVSMAKKFYMIMPSGHFMVSINVTDPVNKSKVHMKSHLIFSN